jgi:large subunit ribosomal protein L23
MALFKFLKKKEEPEKKTAKKEVKKTVKKEIIKPVVGKKGFSSAYRVLIRPHVTEKATDLESQNKYVFEVFAKTNKIEIKKAVEGIYGVNVINVSIINIHKKKRRVGRKMQGWRKGYKKAIVTIKKGQKIEIMPR